MTKRGAALTAALVSAALAATLGACSLLVPLDAQQCSSDDDCLGRGEGFAGSTCTNHVCVLPVAPDGDAGDGGVEDANKPDTFRGPWDCLSDPPQVTNANDKVAITIIAFDPLKPVANDGDSGTDLEPTSYTAEPGLQVTACNILDPSCATPISPPTLTDDGGLTHFTANGNFVGVIQTASPDILPNSLFPGALLAHATKETLAVASLHTKDVQLLAFAVGVPLETNPEAGVGHAFFQIYDCFDKQQAGVTFTMDIDGGPQTVQWYTANQLPSTTSTQTDELGAGGAVNVPVGALTVHATLAATGQKLGVVNAVIRPASTTFAWVRVRVH